MPETKREPGDFEFEYTPHAPDSPEQPITAENAVVVIAQELRSIKRTLHALAFDPNCETTLDGLKLLTDLARDDWPVTEVLKNISDTLHTIADSMDR
jgi:hypothetical protein